MTFYRALPTCTSGGWSSPSMPSVPEERDPGAYSQLLLESPGGGTLPLSSRPSPQCNCIADTICSGFDHCKSIRPAKKTIAFIRAGQKPTATSRTSSSGLLSTAEDCHRTEVRLSSPISYVEVGERCRSNGWRAVSRSK